MDDSQLSKYYNRCNPDEALSPDDDRFVDLDSVSTHDEFVRGEDWARKIARPIEIAGKSPKVQYFTGLRGSGKSTELKKLVRRLEQKSGANLLPVLVDAEEFFDLASEIDMSDVLLAVVYRADLAVVRLTKPDATEVRSDGYFRRLWNYLTKTDVELTRAEHGIDSTKLIFDLKSRPTLRQRVRALIAERAGAFVDQVRKELTELEAEARAHGRQGIVVIVDSLEKLQGTSTNWSNVLASAERMFQNSAPHLRLPVHAIYTVPPALILRLNVQVEYLPMIKLFHRDGQRFQDGFDKAKEIVFKRLEPRALNEIFGPTNVGDRVERIVRWSGGYPREIVRLLQAMMVAEKLPVQDKAFERILHREGDSYRRVVLNFSAAEFLARVAVDGTLELRSDDERELADRMLNSNIVFKYLNDTEWFGLHPAVREMKEVRDAIDALQTARARDRG